MTRCPAHLSGLNKHGQILAENTGALVHLWVPVLVVEVALDFTWSGILKNTLYIYLAASGLRCVVQDLFFFFNLFILIGG